MIFIPTSQLILNLFPEVRCLMEYIQIYIVRNWNKNIFWKNIGKTFRIICFLNFLISNYDIYSLLCSNFATPYIYYTLSYYVLDDELCNSIRQEDIIHETSTTVVSLSYFRKLNQSGQTVHVYNVCIYAADNRKTFVQLKCFTFGAFCIVELMIVFGVPLKSQCVFGRRVNKSVFEPICRGHATVTMCAFDATFRTSRHFYCHRYAGNED